VCVPSALTWVIAQANYINFKSYGSTMCVKLDLWLLVVVGHIGFNHGHFREASKEIHAYNHYYTTSKVQWFWYWTWNYVCKNVYTIGASVNSHSWLLLLFSIMENSQYVSHNARPLI